MKFKIASSDEFWINAGGYDHLRLDAKRYHWGNIGDKPAHQFMRRNWKIYNLSSMKLEETNLCIKEEHVKPPLTPLPPLLHVSCFPKTQQARDHSFRTATALQIRKKYMGWHHCRRLRLKGSRCWFLFSQCFLFASLTLLNIQNFFELSQLHCL